MTRISPAEKLLRELGITEPSEIDLEAIAWHVGAKIKYRELDGCDARILGINERAIITVDSRQNSGRQRFSVGHELGHWEHHKGQALMCRPDEIADNGRAISSSEQVANAYAADLILPWYLVRPVIRGYSKLTTAAIDEVGSLFNASRTATAIRIIQSDEFPAILVCHDQNGRLWFRRSRCIPKRWFPQAQLDSDSYTFDLVFGGADEKVVPSLMPAEAWFDRSEARKYDLLEQSFRVGNNMVMTLLLLSDDEMLSE